MKIPELTVSTPRLSESASDYRSTSFRSGDRGGAHRDVFLLHRVPAHFGTAYGTPWPCNDKLPSYGFLARL